MFYTNYWILQLETSCDIIISLAEVLKVQDTEFLSLELSVRKNLAFFYSLDDNMLQL